MASKSTGGAMVNAIGGMSLGSENKGEEMANKVGSELLMSESNRDSQS
jgi:hypothetical protein